jgi:hypothetical protein
MGERYRRRHLHDWYGGNRQSGIAPSADYPFVFLFTSPTGSQYGYVDEFRDGGVDRPENVLAICPTCHRRVHYGADGDEFNGELRKRTEDRDPEPEL